MLLRQKIRACYYADGTLEVSVAGFTAEFDAAVTKQSASEIASGFFSSLIARIRNAIIWILNDIRYMLPTEGEKNELGWDVRSLVLALFYEVRNLICYIR